MSFDDDNGFGDEDDDEENEDQMDEREDNQNEDEPEDDQDQDQDEDEDEGGDDDDREDGDGDDTTMQDTPQANGRVSSSTVPGTLSLPDPTTPGHPLNLAPLDQSSEGQPQSQGEQTQTQQVDSTTRVERPTVRPEALTALTYDIVPTIAAPHSTSINAITATPNLKYVFSGGSDGYIRKFNWPDTSNGKSLLTVAQRHPFVDSVTKAGVLTSYWENEEPNTKPGDYSQSLSPVYSLAVHKNALWLLSGLESGGINLQSVRIEEGKRIHCLKKHTSAVSVLSLAQDERSVLSGSWDKTIIDWSLDTGQIIRAFEGSGSQISAIEIRPESSLPIPEHVDAPPTSNGTFSTSDADKALSNGLPNGAEHSHGLDGTAEAAETQPSPAASHNSFSSLFGDNDNDNTMETNFGGGGDEDNDLFGGAVTGDMKPDGGDDEATDATMTDAPQDAPPQLDGASEPAFPATQPAQPSVSDSAVPQVALGSPPAQPTNGTSTSAVLGNERPGERMSSSTPQNDDTSASDPAPTSANTFLSASIDGSIRIWDKRQARPVVRLPPRSSPPWCTSAVWSPDGNFFYAGRRNGTVEEYSLHRATATSFAPSRTFRFPAGSGPVSSLRAMPNGRHLVCASYDILRMYDLQHDEQGGGNAAVKTPFLIVPGHRTGVVSALYLDPTCKFMISTAGNRGWEGTSTQVLLGYEIVV